MVCTTEVIHGKSWMASAVLANRSEGNWPTQPKSSAHNSKFMGKVPNPNPKKRQFHQASEFNGYHVDESPAVTQSAASDDASSINRRPNDFNTNNHVLFGNFVSFNIASYSKKELLELKNRLILELEQIRQLKNRIESPQFRSGLKKMSSTPTPGNNKFLGNKRSFSTNLSQDLKRLNQDNIKLMKNCAQILSKLMKHKHGYIFNSPVDVVGLGLHDYYDIIKNPMDLGTIKSKMAKNLYSSPLDFASDVRLTFSNAMTYNPKGHDVYIIAEQLLARFEELFRSVNEKLVQEDIQEQVFDEELQANSWSQHEIKEKEPPRPQISSKSEPMRVPPANSNPNPNPNPNPNSKPNSSAASQLPVRTPSPVRVTPAAKPLKQPKPKAKDPNKREMSMEEKHKLGIGLQSLPQEKMEQVVHILRKRNGNLRQDDDEIELDIEALDTETLWELDRLVTNYKKMVSKLKRQALMGVNNVANPEVNRVTEMDFHFALCGYCN